MNRSFCWVCGRKLRAKAGGGYTFTYVTDGDGTKHKAHKECDDRRDGGRAALQDEIDLDNAQADVKAALRTGKRK